MLRRDGGLQQPAPHTLLAHQFVTQPGGDHEDEDDDDDDDEDEEEEDDETAAEAESARRLSALVASESIRPDSILAHLGRNSRWLA